MLVSRPCNNYHSTMVAGVSWIDLVILAVVALGAWRGFVTGAILEVARIVGLVIAFVAAVQLMDTAGLFTAGLFGLSEQMAPLVGFVVVFLGVMAAVTITARIIQYVIGKVKLGGLNKLAGGAIGAAKSALLVSILLLMVGAVGFPDASTKSDSSLYGPVSSFAPTAWRSLSRALPDQGMDLVERLNPRSRSNQEENLD